MVSEHDAAARIAALESEVARLQTELAAARRDASALGEGDALLSEAERIVHLGCWMWDMPTNHVRWSDGMFNLLGLRPGDVVPGTEAFFERVHPDDAAGVRDATARSLQSGAGEPRDFRMIRADGEVRCMHMEGTVLPGSRMIGTLLDVTERIAIESRLRQSQKMEAIGTLAGGIAHDFNNYLQVIFGHLDLLDSPAGMQADLGAALAQIRDAAERSQRLTRQLLVFSRRRVSEPEVVSLDQLLDQAAPMFEALLGDRARLRRVRTDEDVSVRVDRGSLEQVVLNLVVNARDAMETGGCVTIALDTVELVEARGTLRPGRYVVLEVTDEGTGIAPAIVPRIFEPFFTTKGVGKGTGLGLATAHGIVTHSGGTIEVDSVVGRGTTMRVLLPRVGAVSMPLSRSAAAPRGRGRVLVVEDQPQIRTLVCRQLEAGGYDVLEAEHGLDALRVLDAHADVELVLSDVSMPRMTGSELARKLGEERPQLPVILMAGLVDSNVGDLAVPVLHKPFLREDLLRLVGGTLRARDEKR